MKLSMLCVGLVAAGLAVGCDEKAPTAPAAPPSGTGSSMMDKAKEAAADTAKAATDTAAAAADKAKEAGAAAADKVKDAGAAVADKAKDAAAGAKDAAAGALDKAKEMGADALKSLGGKPEDLLAKAKELIGAGNMPEAKTILEKLKGVQDMLPDAIKKELPELLKKVGL